MNWLEISLSTDGEQAEAIVEVLSRHLPNSVATELILDDDNPGEQTNQVVIHAYLPVDGSEAVVKDRIEHDLWHLRQIQSFPEPAYRLIEQQDWTEKWRENYRPMPIGDRFVLIPAWYEPGVHTLTPLILEPGMAFGTGTHPTTRLCVQALETHVQRSFRVYDIGCGSGILSIASALLGASDVVALDIDPAALNATHENAERNHVSTHVQTFSGTLEDYLSEEAQDLIAGDLVVANILSKVLIDLIRAGLSRLLDAGGKLVLSGILTDQIDQVLDAVDVEEFDLIESLAEADWRALVFKKKKPPLEGAAHG